MTLSRARRIMIGEEVPMSVAVLEEVDIPRVQGQHRNKALAKMRRLRAIQLVTNGYHLPAGRR